MEFNLAHILKTEFSDFWLQKSWKTRKPRFMAICSVCIPLVYAFGESCLDLYVGLLSIYAEAWFFIYLPRTPLLFAPCRIIRIFWETGILERLVACIVLFFAVLLVVCCLLSVLVLSSCLLWYFSTKKTMAMILSAIELRFMKEPWS